VLNSACNSSLADSGRFCGTTTAQSFIALIDELYYLEDILYISPNLSIASMNMNTAINMSLVVSSILSSLKDVATAYATLCNKNPYLVNAACGAFCATAGDAICQTMVDARHQPDYKYNVRRTLNIGLIRVLFAVPFILWWYVNM